MPTERYTIGPKLLGDIRQTITRVDAIAPSTSGPQQEPRLQSLPNVSRVYEGTYNGPTWYINETAAVTFYGETNTVSVVNTCFPLEGHTVATTVYFAPVRGTMTLLTIQLSSLPNYDESVGTDRVQLLGNKGGCLTWIDTTACG